MSRRATLTTILTAMLLVAIPYTVLATDSDGDGTDDADDDFPNNPCADTDTDGDGLPDTVVSGCSSQSVVGYTSFEDPYAASIQYTDTGIDSVNRYLWNNANESHVAHNQTTGSEMGFTLYYTSTGGAGLTDGDYFGTVNYTGTVGNFTDGTKGYQMSDVDGITTLTLDDITAETLTFDLFVQDTGWEWSSSSYDYINISFIGANSDISILSTYGTDIDTGYASYLGTWTSMAVAIGTAGNGHLEFEFSSNAGPEAIYIDNIQFTSTVVLTADLDDDGDGWLDVDETDCGTDPLDGNDVPADADSNGICDALEGDDFDGDGISNDQDPDDDNDGVDDADDAFPLNPNEWDDTDSDGIGDNADLDDDNDAWTDVDESACGTDPLDGASIPSDYDNDMVCDSLDSDDDNDLVLDVDDAFPNDPYETVDTDGDGVGDNADLDDDGDVWTDAEESACGTDPLDSASIPSDYDNDMVCDSLDSDDDDDGWTDTYESDCNTNPSDASSIPLDSDGDGTCDFQDFDGDNDGVNDADDAFPSDSSEWADTDGDGTGDNADSDDDGDGTDDVNDAFPLDHTQWAYADSILFQNTIYDGYNNQAIEGANLCMLEPNQDLEPCRTSDGNGIVEWTWLSPSETDFALRFDLEGHTSMLYLGHYDDDVAALRADELESTGMISSNLIAFTTFTMNWWLGTGEITMDEGAGHIFIIVSGNSDDDFLSGITASLADESGTVVYWGSDGSTLDSGLTESSVTGSIVIANIAPGTYDLSLKHLDLVCDDTSTWRSDSPNEYTVPVQPDTVTQIQISCTGDSDGDGEPNSSDWAPLDSSETMDSDGDGIGDNADPDDDGDGVADGDDASPLDAGEWDDTDGDGIGDNTDLDDDNDGWSDAEENECGTDQYDSDSTPVDYDSNGVCDVNDPIVEPEPEGTPGFGLISALAVLALAALARRD